MSEQDAKRFSPETLDHYFRGAVPTAHPLATTPLCTLFVDPGSRQLRLRTPATDAPADVGVYDRLVFDVVEEPGEDGIWFELRVDAEGMAYESYSLIMSVVDQLEAGRPFRQSVTDSLATFKELLTRKRPMSEEQEVGLFGELEVFAHLVVAVGEDLATAAWLGPDNEEHDFVLNSVDLEVKTTRTEARVHTIGSPAQLTSSPGRPLQLLSIQITSAGAAEHGETLVERVRRVRGMLNRSVRIFDERLHRMGWRDRDADELYTRRFVARSMPRTYPVDDAFPAITPEGIAAIVRRPELVVGLVYRLDLTNQSWCEGPPELFGFCEERAANGT